MRILYLTNVPSPYRVDFFNELGKKCDLTVTFEKKNSDERGTAWIGYKFKNFRGVFLKGKSINTDTAICPGILTYVRDKSFDRIICTDFLSPTGMIAVEYMKIHHIQYWIESDGGFSKNGKGIKERIKKYFISGANGYFSTAEEHDKYYIAYGADPKRIYRYPFTSLRKVDLLTTPPTIKEKRTFRHMLGIRGKYVVLAVGQFINRKGFDVLIRAMEYLDREVGVYIVGGTPTEEYIGYKEQYGFDNLHFCGYKSKDELKKYYIAADIFVHPTREDIWGLVVNEALAYGLPVITTNKCIAGLELLNNSINGYIVPVDDCYELADKIRQTLEEKENMTEKALGSVVGYTIENMVETHLKILSGGGYR